MSESADVVIVGGGILGAWAGLHLKEAGVQKVVLVERDDVAQGTSAYGGGFVGEWAGGYVTTWSEPELVLERYALQRYAQLDAERGAIGYKQNGNLWVASNEEAWQSYLLPLAHNPSVSRVEVVDAERTEELTQILPASAVYRAVFHPNGAQVRAQEATRAVVDEFRRREGVVHTRRPVRSVTREGARVGGIDTDRGPIRATTVVVAAGAWTNQLLRSVDEWLPMVPLVATRIVTEPLGVPDTMPTLMLQEYSFLWLREEEGGLLWGCSYDCPPRYDLAHRSPPERLDQLEHDGIEETIRVGARAARTIPVLARYRSYCTGQGAPTYTADTCAMVGPVAGIDGLFVVAGCNEAGITHGPGYGKLLAELVIGSDAHIVDPAHLSPGRFGERYSSPLEVAEAVAASGSIFDLSRTPAASAFPTT